MSETRGTVDCLSLSERAAFVGIRTSATSVTPFILWSGTLRAEGPITLYIPELSIALARGLSVTIFHDVTSGIITGVRVHAS